MAEYLSQAIFLRLNTTFIVERHPLQKTKERFGYSEIDRPTSLPPIQEEIENHNIPKQENIFSMKKPQKSIREISTQFLTTKLETDELLNEISVLNNELTELNNELNALNNKLNVLNNAHTAKDQNPEYKPIQENKSICNIINKFFSSKTKDKKIPQKKEILIEEIKKNKNKIEKQIKDIRNIKHEKKTQIKEIKTRLSAEIETTSQNAYLNFSTQYS